MRVLLALVAALALQTNACSLCCGGATDASSTADGKPLPSLTLAQVAQHVQKPDERTFIFDSNPRDMYVKEHVPGARWVPYNAVSTKVLPVDRSATLIFYCANPQCSASPHAARSAIALGYTNVYVMPEGIFGWTAAGLPVEKG